ncbi:hypothetical protein E3N88_38268 [Mikania micrantha]|uniref:Tetraspanin n=1 Tax=Mikania micrantha TaxID=192012 RepID=A0A5N6LTH4_9ASTR|nr:hypothetical protein E3N88_38268 [Mikania micrantha]
MLLLIAALMAVTIFGFIVTGAGGGMAVSGRFYNEYHLQDYSPWLRKRVEDPKYWMTIRSCILGSKTCRDIVMWSPVDYLTRDMSPLQSGCCKPPSECTYEMSMMSQNIDCYKWNNDPSILCYECDSCKAGVLEGVRRDWRGDGGMREDASFTEKYFYESDPRVFVDELMTAAIEGVYGFEKSMFVERTDPCGKN